MFVPLRPYRFAVLVTSALVLWAGCALDRSGLGPPDVDSWTTSSSASSSSSGSQASTGTPPAPSNCGNAKVEAGEACDDGNDNPDDGCIECRAGFDCLQSLPIYKLGFGEHGPYQVFPGQDAAGSKSDPALEGCSEPTDSNDDMLVIEPEVDGILFVEVKADAPKLFYALEYCNAPFVYGNCFSSEGSQPLKLEYNVSKGQRLHLVVEAKGSGDTSYNVSLTIEGCGDGKVQAERGETCDDGNTIEDDGCTSSCQVSCPPDWTIGPDLHCYQRRSKDLDWQEAKQDCDAFSFASRKAFLASVPDQAAYDFALQLLPTGRKTWVGGSDAQTEGTFLWLSNEPWTWPYKQSPPWKGSSEPNNSFGEDCLELWNDYGSSTGFNDEDCGSDRDSLCEWVPPGLPPGL